MITVGHMLDPERSMWDLIAVEVRRQRELHQLSGNRLAQILECDRSTVSRIETGLRRLSPRYAARLDELWRTAGLFTRLVGFADASDDGDWFTGLTEYEARATHYRAWEALMIPGLLQTPDYARAALSVGMVGDVDDALRKRLARQEAFFRRKRTPHMTVLLNWVVLAQPVGNAAIMREQLARLLEVGELPNVNVDDHDIAFADAPEQGRLMIDPPDVQRFQVSYDRISNVAAPIGPSRVLIERAMETYE
jgi:transcriptional regulator with XRE-family HTH domain